MKIETKRSRVDVVLTLDEDEARAVGQVLALVGGGSSLAAACQAASQAIIAELRLANVDLTIDPPRVVKGKVLFGPALSTTNEDAPEPVMGVAPKFK